MEELGELTGILIIALFVVEALRFALKYVFKNYGRWIKENTKYHPLLLKAMNINKLFHPWLGYLILVVIVIHSYIQTNGYAFLSNTGLIAASLMATEVVVGFIGTYLMKKPRPKYWIWIHRLVPIATLLAILVHI